MWNSHTVLVRLCETVRLYLVYLNIHVPYHQQFYSKIYTSRNVYICSSNDIYMRILTAPQFFTDKI